MKNILLRRRFAEKGGLRIVYLAALFALMFSACTQMAIRQEFDENVNKYNKLLSSQSFDSAGLFASGTLVKEFSARIKAAAHVRVVDYRIVKVAYDEKSNKAEVVVEIQYYSLSTYKVKTLIDIQKWAYVAEDGIKQWRLLSLLPEFP